MKSRHKVSDFILFLGPPGQGTGDFRWEIGCGFWPLEIPFVFAFTFGLGETREWNLKTNFLALRTAPKDPFL